MSEYWKPTPKYWCKFCEVYVRDTGLERKNHEASGKHQGAIQRSLREVHKGKQREEWEQQNAKREVARLNGLVGQPKSAATSSQQTKTVPRTNAPRVSAPAIPVGDAASQRRRTAEQWLAMGIPLPKELQQELAGSGEWQTVSEKVVRIGIKAEEDSPAPTAPLIKGVHKRKVDDEDEEDVEDQPRPKKAWGNRFKSYDDTSGDPNHGQDDLDTLLSGVTRKPSEKKVATVYTPAGLHDDAITSVKTEHVAIDTNLPEVKQEEGDTAVTAPPIVTFKKRKGKR